MNSLKDTTTLTNNTISSITDDIGHYNCKDIALDCETNSCSQDFVYNHRGNGPFVEYFENLFKYEQDSTTRLELVSESVPPPTVISRAGTKPIQIRDISRLELHVEADIRFPYIISKLITSCFRAYRRSYGFNKSQVRNVIPYLEAAVYFESCAAILKALDFDCIKETYQPLEKFKSELCSSDVLGQLQSLKKTKNSHKGQFYVKNGMLTVHRWMFSGLVAERVSFKAFDPIDMTQYYLDPKKSLVFGGEYSSYHFVRGLIDKEFKIFQEEQGEVFDRMRRFVQDLSNPSVNISNKPLHWRQSDNVTAPTDFDIEDFDPENPFSILKNVPKQSPYYKAMKTLCTAYDLDLPEVKHGSYNWHQAILDVDPSFDFALFELILNITIILPDINGSFMIQRFLEFKQRFNLFCSSIKDVDDLPTDFVFIPLVANRQYLLASSDSDESNENTLVEDVEIDLYEKRHYEYFQATY